MEKIMKNFGKIIITTLIFMMMLVILLSTIELGFILIQKIITPPYILLEITTLLDIFGFFFMILIGIELLETIRTYIAESHIHVETVFLVAMIAIARKVIILDVTILTPLTLIGIAAIIIALSGGYFILKSAHKEK